jgi:hypothetical protein
LPLGLDHRKNPGRNTWHPNCTGCPFLATLATGRLGDFLSSDALHQKLLSETNRQAPFDGQVEVEDIYFGKKPQQLGHFRVF